MKDEKFKVLLYLKKSSPDKSGMTPIMGRVTVGQSMAQFSCKLSCTPSLWNPRESRLNGKSREAVATNAKLDKLLLSVNEAYDTLIERKQPFDAEAVKNLFQGSMDTQITLLKLFDRHIEEVKARVGIDVSHRTIPNYLYTRKRLGEFIKGKFNSSDLAFSQLNEQFIRDFQDFIILEKGLGVETARHYLALLKKICRIAFKEGHAIYLIYHPQIKTNRIHHLYKNPYMIKFLFDCHSLSVFQLWCILSQEYLLLVFSTSLIQVYSCWSWSFLLLTSKLSKPTSEESTVKISSLS
jgi:hypothetical protein